MSLKAAAAAFCVSPATAHRWWHRWLDASGRRGATLVCLLDRSSRPTREPAATRSRARQERICDCRRGPVGGRGSSLAPPASPTRRSGRCCPSRSLAAAAAAAGAGQPLRVALPRRSAAHGRLPLRALSCGPDTRVTGDRSQRSRNWMRPETRVGYDYAHAIVDDHSRLAYVELHDRRARRNRRPRFVERALACFADHGISPNG